MREIVSDFRQALAEDGPIIAGLALVCLGMVVLLAAKGVNGVDLSSFAHNLLLYLVALAVVAVIVMGSLLYRARPASPIGFLIALAARPDWARRLARGIPMLLALLMLMPVFSAVKSAIPVFNAYSWDSTWISADRTIHGMDAWRLLQPVLGIPIVTSLLSYAYHAWFALIFLGGVYFCFFANDRELRAQYFIGFFAIWIVIGLGLATAFSSVGPCFLTAIVGDHSFDAQMAYLRMANEHYPVLVLPVQDMLLERHLQGDHGLGSGISAMPSLHVGMALLFALAMWRVSKPVGIAAFAFVAVILVGSVHLAYHYAVDGYLAIVATAAIWALARPAARWVVRRGDSRLAGAQPGFAPGAATA